MGGNQASIEVESKTMAEKFNLKWNDFHSNVVKSFRNIREDEDLFDVTFACDDQQQISAHKLILSSSSEYFKNIFKQNRNPHPLLCFLDVSSGELKHILDYIYYGEVEIGKDDLDRFLNISKRLKIEGLSGDKENLDMERPIIKEEMEEIEYESKDITTDEIKDVEKTLIKRKKKKQKLQNVNSDELENIEELEKKLSEYIERRSGKSFKCLVCEKICNYRFAAMEHVQLHFSKILFQCNTCDTSLKTTAGHRQHMKNTHNILRESKPMLKKN